MKPADALLAWLDDVPLNELTSKTAASVVKMYREKEIVLSHAMTELWEKCSKELEEWVNFNESLENIDAILSQDESI